MAATLNYPLEYYYKYSCNTHNYKNSYKAQALGDS